MNTYKFKIDYKEDRSRDDRLKPGRHLDELVRGLALSVGDLEISNHEDYTSEGNLIVAKTKATRADVLDAIKHEIRANNLDVIVIDEN
ncbi:MULTISPECIES: hypothetical protein [unclassified Gluconobacter]|uniref:hypothetical protein n=1 Tax=unclassified Gluconobacter TaxID=2644261 RepID=UPI001C05DFA1|nr:MULTISPECIES: hypothetical protein [unclassified Gluconobacter]